MFGRLHHGDDQEPETYLAIYERLAVTLDVESLGFFAYFITNDLQF